MYNIANSNKIMNYIDKAMGLYDTINMRKERRILWMKTIEISYNPYKITAQMFIDGIDKCQNSNYDKFKEFQMLKSSFLNSDADFNAAFRNFGLASDS